MADPVLKFPPDQKAPPRAAVAVPDRLRASGTYRFEEGDDGPGTCEVEVEGELAVRVPIVGKSVEKVIVNLERYGNTSAASIPIALDEAIRTGRVRKGQTILLLAFGGGLTWASFVLSL